jgi:integrase/recombinase XerD
MKRGQISQDLIYPSVEIQVVGKTKPTVENKPKQQLEVLTAKEVSCPKCGSKNYRKRGKAERNGQRYECKDCQRRFVIHSLVNQEGIEIKCPDCHSRNYNLHGKVGDKTRYKCQDCNRQYILTRFVKDEFDWYNNTNCRWCKSKNFRLAGLAKSGKPRCFCKDCKKEFTLGAERPDILVAPKEFQFSHDIWTADHLGYERGIHKHYKLNFGYIQQPWLKYYFKKFILYLSSTRLAFSTLIGKVNYINIFSKFLQEICYTQEFEGIKRALIIEYFTYLKNNQYSYSQHTHCISTIKTFFETGILNNWFQVEPALIRPEDWLKEPKRLPRFIPEEVMQQLNQHLDSLPEPIMRMVLIDIECGFRIGELLRLKLDCLKSDGKGGWYIQYQMYKMNKEHTKPISKELANVIQEQQAYIQQLFGNSFSYLFCGRGRLTTGGLILPEPKLMTSASFIRHLKKLAQQFEIKDQSGKLWNFQTHQFRHTVGTRMINAGVPQHIVQRYLGHESPEMTMVYAYIFDETLRKEVEKYHELRVVNFQGEVTELEETVLSSNDDLEWFKKNVQARALEHGYCARPKVLGDCDIPGFDGCYNCPHWRTNKNFLPVLKDTLERTNNVLEKAQNCGWQLQVHKNTPIKENLEKVIKTLEADND